jgi:hypothetical protein
MRGWETAPPSTSQGPRPRLPRRVRRNERRLDGKIGKTSAHRATFAPMRRRHRACTVHLSRKS